MMLLLFFFSYLITAIWYVCTMSSQKEKKIAVSAACACNGLFVGRGKCLRGLRILFDQNLMCLLLLLYKRCPNETKWSQMHKSYTVSISICRLGHIWIFHKSLCTTRVMLYMLRFCDWTRNSPWVLVSNRLWTGNYSLESIYVMCIVHTEIEYVLFIKQAMTLVFFCFCFNRLGDCSFAYISPKFLIEIALDHTYAYTVWSLALLVKIDSNVHSLLCFDRHKIKFWVQCYSWNSGNIKMSISHIG